MAILEGVLLYSMSRYTGPGSYQDGLSSALKGEASCLPFTQLVSWLVKSVTDLTLIEEEVNPIKDPSDWSNFLMEISGFLREYGCVYPDLIHGPMKDRLNSPAKRLQLLDFLTCELQAVRMIFKRNPVAIQPSLACSGNHTARESDVAGGLKKTLINLGFPKPPGDITAFQLFSKLEAKIKDLLTLHPDRIGKALMTSGLSDKQWTSVMEINDSFGQEYRLRREMLLKRLDVTIQSFLWSDKAKHNQDRIAQVYQPIRQVLSISTCIGIPEILAARDDLTRIEKTSTGEARKHCSINKILIGRVPDRGGRTSELEPPPPEMPSFSKRQGDSQGPHTRGGRGGGGDSQMGGHGAGGRVQGGWGAGNNQSVGTKWDQGGGGYGPGVVSHDRVYQRGGGKSYQAAGGGHFAGQTDQGFGGLYQGNGYQDCGAYQGGVGNAGHQQRGGGGGGYQNRGRGVRGGRGRGGGW